MAADSTLIFPDPAGIEKTDVSIFKADSWPALIAELKLPTAARLKQWAAKNWV